MNTTVLFLLTLGVWRGISAQPAPRADHHQHLFSPATSTLISTATAHVSPIFARDLAALLDSAGIRRAVVLSMGYTWGSPNRSVQNEYDKVRAENDWTSEQVALYPDRLVGFCSFNPIRAYALQELDRCAADPQLRALRPPALPPTGKARYSPRSWRAPPVSPEVAVGCPDVMAPNRHLRT